MSQPFSRLRTLYISVGAALIATFSSLAQADDLQEIFQLAAERDPEIRQARAQFNATHTRIDQGRSALLPTINANAQTSRDTRGPTTDPDPARVHSFQNGANVKGYGINLAGSVAGVVAFGLMSWLELPPTAWFAAAFAVAVLLVDAPMGLIGRLAMIVLLGASLIVVHNLSRHTIWSPYYKITTYQEGQDTVVVQNRHALVHGRRFDRENLHAIITSIRSRPVHQAARRRSARFRERSTGRNHAPVRLPGRS